MRKLLDRLSDIASRAQTSSDPREFKTLSGDLNSIGITIATVAYERGSTFEEFAPVQLAYESRFRLSPAGA